MATQFGERIRELRSKQKMLLRQVASQLDVDTSIISKIERGERPIKKEQIVILNIPTGKILTLKIPIELRNYTDIAVNKMGIYLLSGVKIFNYRLVW